MFTLHRNQICYLTLSTGIRNPLTALIFCIFVSMPISSYPQQNSESQPSEDLYTKGKQALEGGMGIGGAKGWLEFAKQSLSENLTAEILEDVLGQEELPLNKFFDKLLMAKTQKRLFQDGILTEDMSLDEDISSLEFLDRLQNYSQNDVQSKIENAYGGYTQMRKALTEENEQFVEIINDLKNFSFQEVNNRLKIAIDSFNKVIEKSEPEYKVDAYLKLADAYLVMNREQEAVDVYEKCQKLGFGSMTSSIDEFKDIFHRIAKVYWKLDVHPVRYMYQNSDVLEDLSHGVKSKTMSSMDDAGTTVIEDYMKFAEESFKKELQDPNEIESKLIMNKFELVRFYIETCQEKRAWEEYERRYEEVETKLDKYPAAKDEIIALDSEINKVTNTHFTCSFAPEFQKGLFNSKPPLFIVNFFPTGGRLSSEDLGQHFIVTVYPEEGKSTSVKLSNQIILNKDRNKIRRTIPHGNYKVVIKIEKLSTKAEDRIPFRCEVRSNQLSGPGVDEYIVTGKGKMARGQEGFSNVAPLPLSRFSPFTIQSSIYLFPGQAYNLSFEPAPPMPPRKRWWIAVISIASGISILTSILQ